MPFGDQHLGPDAARIVAERKLALPVQIFSIKEARIVSDRSGASDPADPRWQGLATAFATSSSATSSETTSGNEVILGGATTKRTQVFICMLTRFALDRNIPSRSQAH